MTLSTTGSSTTARTETLLTFFSSRVELHRTVVDHFDIRREVVSCAMNCLDRCMRSCSQNITKEMFQLAAMTCLYIAIKLNEYKHLIVQGSTSSTLETILKLSRGIFTVEQMERMEYAILEHLHWRVHPPTPQAFLKYFVDILSMQDQAVCDMAEFLIELSVMDYFFVAYKPSDIGLASLLNAIDDLYPQDDNVEISIPLETYGLFANSPAVLACRRRLQEVHSRASEQSETSADATTREDSPPCVISNGFQFAQVGNGYGESNMSSEVTTDELAKTPGMAGS